MNYFEVVDSVAIPNRWHLGRPTAVAAEEIDPRLFTEGHPFSGGLPLTIPVSGGSVPLGFTFGPFEMPVLCETVGSFLRAVAGEHVQMIPVTVGESATYLILNVLSVIDCLDFNRTELTRWERDDAFPEKTGRIFAVSKIALRLESVRGKGIFRIKDWLQPIIISEQLRNGLLDIGTTGVQFRPIETY